MNPNPFLSKTDAANLIPNQLTAMSSRQMNADFLHHLGSTLGMGLGGILPGGILPWQREVMGQGMIGNYARNLAPLSPLGGSFDIEALRGMLNARAPRRPRPPVAYWQFKNGTTAPLPMPTLTAMGDDEWYTAWDRGLGTYVCYAAR